MTRTKDKQHDCPHCHVDPDDTLAYHRYLLTGMRRLKVYRVGPVCAQPELVVVYDEQDLDEERPL